MITTQRSSRPAPHPTGRDIDDGDERASILVGITGHRNIHADDIPVLSERLRNELDRIALAHPDASLTLVSGLAEGADRLAAQCALDAGWTLGSVMPMPQEEYVADFGSAESVAEFHRLLNQSSWTKVLGEGPGCLRPGCYARLSRWLCSNTSILIALWDGDASTRPAGGTADTVLTFLKNQPSHGKQADAKRVIHILTRRPDQPTPLADIGSVIVYPAAGG